MPMADLPPDIAALSFEEALAELEGIVKRLETGATRLDDAIAAYERGAKLRAHCEARLKEAQARVERIVLGPDGAVSVAPAAVE
jgi:exodeoxyribonuclease VII small subunit